MVNNATRRKESASSQIHITDVIKFINKKHTEGHEIIVCIDGNEDLTHDKGEILKLCKEFQLNDSLDHRHSGIGSNKSYQEGSAHIDFILCSFNSLIKLKRSGMTAFNETTSSDHRC